MVNRIYTFEKDLAKRLKNPKFKKEWEKSETKYQLASEVIKKRLEKNISQRALAKKLKTSQAVISRIETMSANPSMSFLKKLAKALDTNLTLQFG